MSYWYHEDRDANIRVHWGRIVLLAILLVLVIGAIYWAAFGFNVATSGVRGRGNQIKQVNSAENRTFQYNHFFDLYNDVKTLTSQLHQAQQAEADYAAQHKGDDSFVVQQSEAQNHTTTLGVQNRCTDDLNQYNADAAKTRTGSNFRDHNLPDQLPDGPATNCQPISTTTTVG